MQGVAGNLIRGAAIPPTPLSQKVDGADTWLSSVRLGLQGFVVRVKLPIALDGHEDEGKAKDIVAK